MVQLKISLVYIFYYYWLVKRIQTNKKMVYFLITVTHNTVTHNTIFYLIMGENLPLYSLVFPLVLPLLHHRRLIHRHHSLNRHRHHRH